MAEDHDAAYLAGIIDGEGCINIGIHTLKNGITRTRVTVRIVNTDRRLIDWLQERYGGYVRVTKWESGNWKDSYAIIFEDAAAPPVLTEALPYFVLKRRQAEIALEIRELIGKGNVQRRLELFEENKLLNKRGA